MTKHIVEWVKAHQMLCGVVVVLLFFGLYIARLLLGCPKGADLSVSFVNEYNDVGEGSELYENLMELEAFDDSRVVLDGSLFFDLSKKKDFSNAYFRKLVASLEAGTTDAVIAEKKNIIGVARGGRLLDLSDARAGTIVQNYRDRLLYYEDEEAGAVPVAVSLEGSPYEAELGYQTHPYLAFSFQGTHTKEVIILLNLLLLEDK